MSNQNVICGNSEEKLKDIPSESIDLVVTDPPYGYSFMGKDWDKAVPSVNIWKECLRVLKPGAFAFIMSAPRLDVQSEMARRIQDAGFNIAYTPIYWTYASGMPKSMNMSKAIDKALGVKQEVIGKRTDGIGSDSGSGCYSLNNGKSKMTKEYDMTTATSKEAKALDGSFAGFQPKPAVEVILVAMKPLNKKNYIEQALFNGKGVTWLEDCKIPTVDNLNGGAYSGGERCEGDWKDNSGFKNDKLTEFNQPEGRFPANLLVSDDALNDGSISRTDSPNRVPKSTGSREGSTVGNFGIKEGGGGGKIYSDEGGFSRYFSLDAWWENAVSKLPDNIQQTFPFLVVPKASSQEKNAGCEAIEPKVVECLHGNADGTFNKRTGGKPSISHNSHPTVKPVKLMSYLITLGSKEGDTVLDPFAGSGTTGVAAELMNRNSISIELNPEYIEFINARINEIKNRKMKQ